MCLEQHSSLNSTKGRKEDNIEKLNIPHSHTPIMSVAHLGFLKGGGSS